MESKLSYRTKHNYASILDFLSKNKYTNVFMVNKVRALILWEEIYVNEINKLDLAIGTCFHIVSVQFK